MKEQKARFFSILQCTCPFARLKICWGVGCVSIFVSVFDAGRGGSLGPLLWRGSELHSQFGCSAPFTSASAGWPPTPQEQQLRKCRTGCFLYLLAMGRLYLRFVTTCRAGDVSLALVEVECEASVPQAGADAVAASRPDEAFKAKICEMRGLTVSPVMKPPERVFSTFAPSLVGAAGPRVLFLCGGRKSRSRGLGQGPGNFCHGTIGGAAEKRTLGTRPQSVRDMLHSSKGDPVMASREQPPAEDAVSVSTLPPSRGSEAP